jgi:hypothetical protein
MSQRKAVRYLNVLIADTRARELVHRILDVVVVRDCPDASTYSIP